MNIEEFTNRYRSLKDLDIITDIFKCDHPECKGLQNQLNKVAIKRNILKHNGKEFICRSCMMTHDNPMNHIGQSRQTDELITVMCPDPLHEGPKERKMKKSCYFGSMEKPYRQLCGSCSQKGKILSQEQKDKITESLTGRTLSESHKKNISNHMKNNYEGIERAKTNLIAGSGAGWNKGLITPDEVKQKISEANKGKIRTEEQRNNISVGRTEMLKVTGGFTQEHKDNLRKAAIKQYLNGFDQNLYHASGWHDSPKCEKSVFFRSSYEKKAYLILDEDPSVKSYSCEGWLVDYYNPSKKYQCIYIVDLKLNMQNGSIVHVEVKPKSLLNNAIVKSKAFAATLKAAKEGSSYEIWTEIKLFGSDNPKVIAQFCEELKKTLLNAIERQKKAKENYRIKTKRYYDTKIAINKVTVYCEYCKEEHAVLKVNYDKNMKNNGRYICGPEGGHIAGSLPKTHLMKENPYLKDDKKQCNKCREIKPLIEFGDDATHADGKSSRCKKCRAEIATAKYQDKIKDIIKEPVIKIKKENPYATDGRKLCSKCGDIKLLTDFHDCKEKFDGKAVNCKQCRAEAASIKYKKDHVGIEPKQRAKQENPYILEGKKQCTKCKEIKFLNEFNDDKNRLSGKSSNCRECRLKAYAEAQLSEKDLNTTKAP